MFDLKGKVTIVTGASKGIGQTFAVGLANLGADVVVVYNTDEEGATRTAELIDGQAGGSAWLVQADVGAPDSAERIVSEAVSHFGRLDSLVNNAATRMFAPPAEVSREDWATVMRTNLEGPMFLTQSALKVMPPGSSVVNISACAAALMIPNHMAYTTAKRGLEGLTLQYAYECATQARFNVVRPAPTSMKRNWDYDKDFDTNWAPYIPAGRIPVPGDYLGLVAFLLSDASAMINGQIFDVDGGWSIAASGPGLANADLGAYR